MLVDTMLAVVLLSSAAAPAAAASQNAAPPVHDVTPASHLPSIVTAVRADAQRRSGVPADRVSVASSESVTWSDGSLGCPQPGRLYTQALVPGWRIRVLAGDTTHDYHANLRGRWLWCPPGQAVDPVPGFGRS